MNGFTRVFSSLVTDGVSLMPTMISRKKCATSDETDHPGGIVNP